MKSLPMKPSLAAQPYDRSALLSLSDQIIASLRFNDEDKSKARNACQHLADALSRCRGRTLQHRWRSFEKSIWPLWQKGVGRPCVLWTWGARVIVPARVVGFATSGNDQSVVMFDLKTFKMLGRIPAAEDADAILFDGASNRVFTLNGDAHSSTVIDARSGTLIKNIPLAGKPEYGVSAGDGKVYANLTDTSEVVEIDAKTATVGRRWSTAPCKQPVAMAIDKVHHRLFSGCRSGVLAISDYEGGKVVATVPIGAGVDGAGYDSAAGNVFASNADGTLTVIHQD
jgi:hypothetical protein